MNNSCKHGYRTEHYCAQCEIESLKAEVGYERNAKREAQAGWEATMADYQRSLEEQKKVLEKVIALQRDLANCRNGKRQVKGRVGDAFEAGRATAQGRT